MELEQIEKSVKEVLSEKRFYHSVCVMKRCEELAKYFNIDVEKAKKIGIAHDIAKEMSDEDKMEYVNKNNLIIDNVEKTNKGLLHAKIGAHICKEKFGFSEDMIKAIEAHTTGKENMDLLAKVLYMADATGDDRAWGDLEYVRNLILEDIDKAMLYMLDMIIKGNIDKGRLIQIDTILIRNQIMENMT